MTDFLKLQVAALGLLALALSYSTESFSAPVTLFEEIVLNERAPQRGPQQDVVQSVVEKAVGRGLRLEPMPLTGGQRAIQPKADSLELEKFQTAMRLLKDGERLFTNQQFESAAQRFDFAMRLLEGLTFDGAIHGLLVSTHIMWGEALVRRGQTSAARTILGDLVALEPSITLSMADYPNAFLKMLDEVRLSRLSLKPGTLQIRSPRKSVQVSINERPQGMLPLEVNSVVPGVHVVRFETGTMGGKARLVRVAEGSTVELAFELDTLPAITSVAPRAALESNAIDQVVVRDLMKRATGRGTSSAVVPLWHFEDSAWKLTLLELSEGGQTKRTEPRPVQELMAGREVVESWWKGRRELEVSSGWTGVVSGLPISLALPSWLAGTPAQRSFVGVDRLVELRQSAQLRIDAIINGDEPEIPIESSDAKRRPLTRAELAKKFEGQSYDATQPISLEDIVLKAEVEAEPPVWKRWWFWTAVGGAAAIGVTAFVIAQDAEPSTVLVGVTWD